MSPGHNNLPAQVSTFIGRGRELAEVQQLLAATRLVTLTGAGGCGKTTLALHVARDLLTTSAAGVYWVELAPLADPALLPQAIAKAFGILEQPDRALNAMLLDYLWDKELLLILDNCEHLIQACAQLATLLLEQCPELRLLTTSREALNVAGEFVWIVPSLGFPTFDVQPSAASLQPYDAVQLLIERARAVQSDFKLTNENAAAIAQICRHMEGIPLAIELTAACVKMLSVEEIAARLDDALRLLTAGKRSAPPRQQTLRATLDWSYRLLTRQEQILFCRLSVFAGGFMLQAAETVCTDEDLHRDDVFNLLTHLVDKSLVIKQAGSAQAHYRLLEPMRQYALERLHESGEAAKIRDRHLDYFLKLAEKAEPKLTSAERQVWLERLEADHGNLLAALEWSQAAAVNAEQGLRLAGALIWFWYFRNYFIEGQQWLERASSVPFVQARLRAKGLFGAALGLGLRFSESTHTAFESSLELFRQFQDARGVAQVLLILGVEISDATNDFVRAHTHLQEGAAILRQLVREDQARVTGDPGDALSAQILKSDLWWLTRALQVLGDEIHQKDILSGRPILEEGLTLARQLRDPWLIAKMLISLGDCDLWQGDYTASRVRWTEALALFREIGDKLEIARALGMLGELARCEQVYDRAAKFYLESMTLFQEIGSVNGIPWMLHCLGQVVLHAGDVKRAEPLFRESLILRYSRGTREGIAEALDGLAESAAIHHQPERAARLFAAAEAQRQAIGTFLRPYNRALYERYLPQARAQLQAKKFAAAWAEGKAMPLESVIEYALNDTPLPASSSVLKLEYGGLTAREVEVAALIAQGKSNRAIAAALVVQAKTVETHITHILNKLGFTSRAQVAGWAIHKGLASAPLDLNSQ